MYTQNWLKKVTTLAYSRTKDCLAPIIVHRRNDNFRSHTPIMNRCQRVAASAQVAPTSVTNEMINAAHDERTSDTQRQPTADSSHAAVSRKRPITEICTATMDPTECNHQMDNINNNNHDNHEKHSESTAATTNTQPWKPLSTRQAFQEMRKHLPEISADTRLSSGETVGEYLLEQWIGREQRKQSH